jgi:hypothetical protein
MTAEARPIGGLSQLTNCEAEVSRISGHLKHAATRYPFGRMTQAVVRARSQSLGRRFSCSSRIASGRHRLAPVVQRGAAAARALRFHVRALNIASRALVVATSAFLHQKGPQLAPEPFEDNRRRRIQSQ